MPGSKGRVINLGQGRVLRRRGPDPCWKRSAGNIRHGEGTRRGSGAALVLEESRKHSLLCRRIETCGNPGWRRYPPRARRRLRALSRLPPSGRGRECQDPRRAPEIKVVSFRRRRHATRRPHDAPGDALQLLLKGDQLRLAQAKAMKLIDAIVPAGELVQHAKDWIKGGGKAKAPWDEEKFRLPGGPVYSNAGKMTFAAANAIYRRETYDNYPAARAIMQVVYEALQLPMDIALPRRVALVRKDPALAGGGGHDPHAVRLHQELTKARAGPRRSRQRNSRPSASSGRGSWRQYCLCHGDGRARRVLLDREPGAADKARRIRQSS